MQWFQSYLDTSCTAALPDSPSQCWDAATLLPHIETPLFIAQNKFDSCQVQYVLGWGMVIGNNSITNNWYRYYGEQSEVGAAPILASKHHGLFMPACLQHTDNLCMRGGTVIEGFTLRDAMWNWYVNGSSVPRHLVEEGALPVAGQCEC